MTAPGRLNLVVDDKTGILCRELASAKNISISELFRQMIKREAEENKELLEKWRALEDLRKK